MKNDFLKQHWTSCCNSPAVLLSQFAPCLISQGGWVLVSGSWGSHHSFGIMLSDIYTSKHNNMVDLYGWLLLLSWISKKKKSISIPRLCTTAKWKYSIFLVEEEVRCTSKYFILSKRKCIFVWIRATSLFQGGRLCLTFRSEHWKFCLLDIK